MPTSFLDDRQNLIALVVKLNQAIDAGHHDIARLLTQKLTAVLVDYLSAGHFQVFVDVDTASTTYRQIEATTDVAMRFYDRFSGAHREPLDAIKGALETLALTLESRFELEDMLLRRPKRVERAGAQTVPLRVA